MKGIEDTFLLLIIGALLLLAAFGVFLIIGSNQLALGNRTLSIERDSVYTMPQIQTFEDFREVAIIAGH